MEQFGPQEDGEGARHWSFALARRLLRELTHRARRERDPVGTELRRILGTATVRDAVLDVIERALRHEAPLCRATVERCDVRGESTLVAAAELGLSLRSLFRYRRRATEAIGAFLETLLIDRGAARREVTRAAQLTLIGYFHLARRTGAGCAAAQQAFSEAVCADPTDARGYAGLACAHVESVVDLYSSAGPALTLAEAAAQRAVALEPHSAAAQAAMAIVTLRRTADPRRSRRFVTEAMAADARDPLAVASRWLLALSERDLNGADSSALTLMTLEPSSPSQRIKHTLITSMRGDYTAVVEQCRSMLEADPASPMVRMHLMDALTALGRAAEAVAASEATAHPTPYELASRADAYAHLGRRAEAVACARRLDDVPCCRYTRAVAHAAAENIPAALAALEAALVDDPVWRNIAPYDPGLVSLRRLQRFQKLMNRSA